MRTREDLIQALDHQASRPLPPLGYSLVELGFITEPELADALVSQGRGRDRPIGEHLVQQGRITRVQLDTALNHKLGFARVDARAFALDPKAVAKLPAATAHRLHALALALHDGQLIVALADPKRQDHLDDLAWAAQCRIRPVWADAQAIGERLRSSALQAEDDARAPGAASSLEHHDPWLAAMEQQADDEDDSATTALAEDRDNALVKLINTMILDAQAQGASDIHVETGAGQRKVQVRFRIDGRLRAYRELPHTLRSALVARIKVMCALDISERRLPQDGRINFERHMPGHALELRVVTLPTQQGLEDVVMRLLTATEPLPLDHLGMQAPQLLRFQAAIERPQGLILCAGPTGSGKTTTLHAALAHLNTPDRKIWTAEDPIEITQPGLRQVQVRPRIDWTFEKALRAFLRADPDVIMVGEIRDRETARTAVEAALTGHMVMSTIHTNSAPETVTRLLDMGMDPFNFSDTLLAVVAQRLVRRLCDACASRRPATEEEIEGWLAAGWRAAGPSGSGGGQGGHARQGGQGSDPHPQDRGPRLASWIADYGSTGRLWVRQAVGCPQCQGLGMKGRIGLHEVLIVTREIRQLIEQRKPASVIAACAVAQGMVTLELDGILKVLQGLTTYEEVRALTRDVQSALP